MQRSLPLLLIPLAVLCGLPTFAQPAAGSSDPELVEKLLRRGLELREARQDEAALQEFRRAWELSRSGRALAQVALAEQALGRWLAAEEHLSAALVHDEDWIARNRDLLEQALSDIQGHLGWVELTGAIPAGRVSINGQPMAELPTREPIRAPAGSVAIEARAEGYLPILRMVVVPVRGLAREPLIFVRATQPQSAGDTERQTQRTAPNLRWQPRHTAGVLLGAAALGSLATGIAFHVIREERAGAYNDMGCRSPTDPVELRECQSRYAGVSSATYAAIAGYAGAAIMSGVAAYLLFGGSKSDSPGGKTSRLLPRCGLALGPGLVCAGRF